MTGTASQIEWAEQIRPRVNAEFDRVVKAFLTVAHRQSDDDRTDTRAIIAILEEKRAEAMSRQEAGYFIRDWQELNDQVRRGIAQDPRYKAIAAARHARAKLRPLTETAPPNRAATVRSWELIPKTPQIGTWGDTKSSPSLLERVLGPLAPFLAARISVFWSLLIFSQLLTVAAL